MESGADAVVLTEEAVMNVSLLVQEENAHSSKELVDRWAIGFNHVEQAGCTLTSSNEPGFQS